MSERMNDKLGSACRDKLQASEGKLKSAIQDKANVVSEKAAIDRQLKALQAQTGKLTKVGGSSEWARHAEGKLE